MAQMLSKSDSAAKVKRAVRRHLRLSRRQPNEDARRIAERIVEPLATLEASLAKAEAAADQAEDAFDDWHQEDQVLDQQVRRFAFRCREWDAIRSGDQTLVRAFGGMTPSEVTFAPRHKQPDLVMQIVVRARDLPDGHTAKEMLGDLERQAMASRNAHRAYVDAEQRAGAASAAVDIAKIAVIRAYRDNYIDIDRACGREVAEACFPLLRRARRKGDVDVGDSPAGAEEEESEGLLE